MPATRGQSGKLAVADAKRADKPDVIIVNGTFGFEEEVLAGIATIMRGVPLIGGSAAGDLATRGWWVASAYRKRIEVSNDGVSVIMLWTTVQTATIFSSCYEPTTCCGVVTKKAHREILIDNKPASEVYRPGCRWRMLRWRKCRRSKHVESLRDLCKKIVLLSATSSFRCLRFGRWGVEGTTSFFS